MAIVEAVPWSGQSLALGADSTPLTSPAADTAANAMRIQQFNGSLSALAPFGGMQNPDLSAGARMAQYAPDRTVAMGLWADGGERIADLSPGGSTGVAERCQTAMNKLSQLTVAAGNTLTIPSQHWQQGEADQAAKASTYTLDAYLNAMVALRDWYVINLGPLSAASSWPWITCQTATWPFYLTTNGNKPATVGLAQLQAARSVDGMYCVGGQYQLPYAVSPAAPVHLTAPGYYKLGELHARAALSIRSGAGWKPFAPKAYQTLADRIVVTYDVPPNGGSLAFDTTVSFGAATKMGFSLTGTAAQITGVAITAADTVTLYVDRQITEATAKVGYGVSQHNGVVGMGNLRDSTTATSRIDGATLPNWALHSLDPIPAYTTGGLAIVYLEVDRFICVGPRAYAPAQTIIV